MVGKSRRKTLIGIICAILVLILSCQGCTRFVPNVSEQKITPATTEDSLVAEFLDVDQADCELIYLPDGKVMLIDAGNRGDGDEIVAYLNSKDITKIDYLIATHPHADHIGGMADVINTFEIGTVYAPRVARDDTPTSKTYEDFLLAIKNKGLKIKGVAPSNQPAITAGECNIYFFSPNSADYDELNNYSVTVKITYGIHSFLFMGDAEMLSEDEMLGAGYNLSADVLKVGHHGSDSSSGKEFLKAVDPDYAVISCGAENKYNHPHKKTLNALKKIKVLRTDLDNTIIFMADGKTKNGLKFTTKNPTVVD